MSDYSVQAYLERQSSHTLLTFLETWITTGHWYSYEYAVPLVMEILSRRNVQIPEAILSFPENKEKTDLPPKLPE